MDARLFGAVHVDRRGKVRRELDDCSEGTDALCLEQPASTVGVRAWLAFLLRAPLAAAGFGVLAAVQFPLVAACNRDIRPPEQTAARAIAAERDLPVHGVDRPVDALTDYGGFGWRAANYLGLAVLLALSPLASAATALALLLPRAVYQPAYRRSRALGTVLAVGLHVGSLAALYAVGGLSAWTLAVAAVAIVIAVRATIRVRDNIMADATVDVAEREGYEDVTVVAGYAHLPGLHAALADRGATVTVRHRPRFFREGNTTVDPEPPGADADTTAAFPDLDPSKRDVLGRRAAAALVDLVFAAAFGVLGGFGGVSLARGPSVAAMVAGALLAWVGFFVLFEGTTGQTPGKKLLGLAVCDTEGNPPSTRAVLVRNALRLVDVVGVYLVGFVVAVAGEYRRLGDLAAGTLVVDARDTGEPGGSESDG
ncbi:RDD family protein [Halocalculus aciditolerans]|uniref:RDD domain-containing protein n=1 Tax=Halocalculus aciditolerans TaxID=1383812 RepID=A0A830FIQ4_9EURY|nr:RDD family protein [Halocalculus aciditolerans]GGL56761.1 hypothetical protein GCM10009039_13660 [Halocalculus aciditolerans]